MFVSTEHLLLNVNNNTAGYVSFIYMILIERVWNLVPELQKPL
jgi:hypothetical protein